jgi:hypothetical protein
MTNAAKIKMSPPKELFDITKHAIDKGYNNVKLKVSGENEYTLEASKGDSKDKIPKKQITSNTF